jgi:hypothetical protein
MAEILRGYYLHLKIKKNIFKIKKILNDLTYSGSKIKVLAIYGTTNVNGTAHISLFH